MKLRFILFATLLIVLFSTHIYAADQNFRNTKWGMSPKEVKKVEDSEFIAGNNKELGYLTKLLGYDTLILYSFINNKLVRATYSPKPKHTNDNTYVSDYNEYVDVLTQKYGKPLESKLKWRSDLYKGKPKHYGMAVATGRLQYWTFWDLEEITIKCMMNGDNYKISTFIDYVPKKYMDLITKDKKKKDAKAF